MVRAMAAVQSVSQLADTNRSNFLCWLALLHGKSCRLFSTRSEADAILHSHYQTYVIPTPDIAAHFEFMCLLGVLRGMTKKIVNVYS